MKKTLFVSILALAALVLSQPTARAVEPADVKKAIEAGVGCLKASQRDDGSFGNGGGEYKVGATALGALTLLECDVAPDDPCIKKSAELVRAAAPNEVKTYNIAVSILFLDKLRDPVDVALIESLTLRLMAGQNAGGGWGYDCPALSAQEVKRLNDLLKNRTELSAKRDLPKDDDAKRSSKDLPKEIKDQLGLMGRGGGLGGVPANGGGPQLGVGGANGDNSNTQFATLALWVGRRQGMPVEAALGRVARRFRDSVGADGGWTYHAGGLREPSAGPEGHASMTCAGLLGIAISYGVAAEMAEEKAKVLQGEREKDQKPREVPVGDIGKDPVVLNALKLLSTIVGTPLSKLNAQGTNVPALSGNSYYMLWSLERVCVGLAIDSISGKDWYEWGAELIIANQGRNGGWSGDYSTYQADTCFALLFLKRANFARDLSARLRGKLEKKLLRGGVGADTLGDKLAGSTAPKDNGDKSPADGKEVERLSREVVDAKGELQGKLLTDFHTNRDRKYTEALLTGIAQLSGDAKKGARKVLAERLADEGKEKPAKLGEYLDDRDSEIRRAAALACALDESKQHVPQLIGLLRDREALVSRAAWSSLKNITGQNFGPTADATDAEKDRAVAAWREWWTKNGK